MGSEFRGDSELDCWMNEFRNQLEPKQHEHVYETLKANGFTTRLKLKLIREDELNIMFNEVLPLSAKMFLTYQLNLLRDDSPLVSKSKPRVDTDTREIDDSKSNKKTVVRALQDQEEKLKQVIEAKSQLKEIEFNIDSMNVDIREPAAIGNGKSVCGHCHHRGHRNQATKPCLLNKCTDYGYCGIKEKRPEYFSKLNSLKLERRKKENEILEIESQVKSMEQFSTSSEFQFVKNLTPRLYNVDPTYKTNKAKLMRDVRLLRVCLDGKIPAVTTNDAEQLSFLIGKLKRTKGITAEDSSGLFRDISRDLSPVKEKIRNVESVLSKPSNSCTKKRSVDKSSDSELMHSLSSSGSNEDEIGLHSSQKKHRKGKKEKRRQKKAKSKDKATRGRSKRTEHDSSDLTSDDDQSVNKQKYGVNPYFTPFINPFSFCHPNGGNIFPFQSAYGMYGAETVCQQFPPQYTSNVVVHAPANVSTNSSLASGYGYSLNTASNTSPAKPEMPYDFRSDTCRSPTSERVAQTLLELVHNPRVNSTHDV